MQNKTLKIDAIVQARMSSKRFPGKVLHGVKDRPLLLYIIERLRQLPLLQRIIIATSEKSEDDAIEEFCKEQGLFYYRGHLDNVVARFNGVLEHFPMDAFVRVNGDSPLIDQQLIKKGIEEFLKGNYDLVTNVYPRSYPKGQSVEIVSSKTFILASKTITEKDDQEHVTRYFYNNAEKYRIYNMISEKNISDIQLSVDTQEGMNNFTNIIYSMNKHHWEYNLEEVLELYNSVILRED